MRPKLSKEISCTGKRGEALESIKALFGKENTFWNSKNSSRIAFFRKKLSQDLNYLQEVFCFISNEEIESRIEFSIVSKLYPTRLDDSSQYHKMHDSEIDLSKDDVDEEG